MDFRNCIPYLAEFLGTFVIVFATGCNQLSVQSGNSTFAVTSTACALMVMVYSFSRICGAHFNPAVTLAVALAGRMNDETVASACPGGTELLNYPRKFLVGGERHGTRVAFKVTGYVLAQLLGGVAAGFWYSALFLEELQLRPVPGHTWWEAGICETLYTAMLCFVFLNTAIATRNTPNQFYGLAIGFVIVAGGYAAGPISGAAFNPAVTTGVSLFSSSPWWCLPYCAFQFMGSLLAVLLFRLVRPEDFAAGPTSADPCLSTKLASEFIGTFMLVLTVGLNVLAGSTATAWSAAAALMCMIYSLGDVSGGHFNPAVTVAVLLTKRTTSELRKSIAYIPTQVCAGILAGLLFAGLHDGATFALGAKAPYTVVAAHVVEFVFTFVLALVVLSTTVVKGISSTLPRNFYFALAIGACVAAGGVAAGNVSGGELNPAVNAGIAIVHAWQTGGGLLSLVTFSLTQLAAGCTAAAVFAVTHESQIGK